MSLRPISAEWEKFASVFLPENAPEVQRIHMRFAFFAGAASLNSLLLKNAHSPDDATIDVETQTENIKKIFEAATHESNLFLESLMLATELRKELDKTSENAPSA